ncbi:MAG: DUF4335 domain-containing protein, partial [Microcystaceae cyanobacterium]
VLPAPLDEPRQATIGPSFSTTNGVALTPELDLPKLPPLNNQVAMNLPNNSINTRSAQGFSDSVPNQPGLLDPIPQVVEVRNYFQKTWKPSSQIEQTLEYRLLLRQDGSIQQVTPLGRAAAIYQPQTGMPTLEQPFVSPLSVEGKQTLRLVLTPTGDVKTFLEETRY